MKRILSAIITISMILACMAGSLFLFTGCKPDIEIDPTRTQLYIGVKDDGIGKEWVYDAITKFETAYSGWKNPSDDSKTGVQVIPKFEDDLYEEKNVITSMPSAKESVYVLSGINFFSYLNSDNTTDKLVNLWDVVTEDPDGTGPELSIYDRMDPQEREHLTVDLAGGGKAIYTLPYHENYWGLIYDMELFEDKGFYNLEEYTGLDCFEGPNPENDNIDDDGYGPDGKPGTYDDGLPSTWEDFKILLDVMVEAKVTPFTWTYQYYTYQTGFLKSVMASYEGKHDYELRYNMDGIDSDVGQIDYKTGWKLTDQEGIKAALTVAKHIASNPNYYSKKAYYSSQSHLAAQDEFITSVKDAGAQPIGFLIESGWWENEAKGTFASMQSAFGDDYAYGSRKFAWLPFPKFIGTDGIKDQENMKTTMYSGVGTGGGGWMLSKNVTEEIKPLAFEFIKFCNSADMMARFTEVTGINRPYEYQMSDTQIANMTSYTRTVYENKMAGEDIELIRYKTRNPLIVNASSFFADYEFYALLYEGEARQTSTKNPLTAFKDDATLTVEDYIDGIKARYSHRAGQEPGTQWNNNLSKWYYLFENN